MQEIEDTLTGIDSSMSQATNLMKNFDEKFAVPPHSGNSSQ